MTPQEAEPDLPVSDAGSPAEVCQQWPAVWSWEGRVGKSPFGGHI